MTILEIILYNLFPAALADQLLVIVKDITPLISIALVRVILYATIGMQKLQQLVLRPQEHTVRAENYS